MIYTAHDDEPLIGQLLRAGARGYVLKSDVAGDLITAVQSLAEHKPFFTSKLSEALLASMLTSEVHDGICLTYEERIVVQLIAEGYTNREIAETLDTHVKTVENRRNGIIRKLNLTSSAALVVYAMRNGLVKA